MNNSQYYKTGGIRFRLTSIFTFEYITTYIYIYTEYVYMYIVSISIYESFIILNPKSILSSIGLIKYLNIIREMRITDRSSRIDSYNYIGIFHTK